MTTRIASFVFLAFFLSATVARAQSFDLSAHVVGSRWSEFDGADLGIGGRLSWKPTPILGVEGEFNWYPSGFPSGHAFSGERLEGMFAVTAGPKLGRVRPFVRAGAGFLNSSEAPEAFPCIAIFPPPLACALAAGDTMPTFEFGGGLEITTSRATFLRFDAGDRMVKYHGPTFGAADELLSDGFVGHAFKFTFGGGWRF